MGVDFNDFLDGLGGDVGALTGTGIYCDDDPSLEDEAESGGSVVGFDVFYDLTLKGVDLREEEEMRGGGGEGKKSEGRKKKVCVYRCLPW